MSNSSFSPRSVKVKTNRGDIPFSVGYLANTLLSTGLSQETAYHDAYSISMGLVREGRELYTSDEIMDLTASWYDEKNPKMARRVRIIKEDFNEIKPLVVLLGGVTGVGKSTLAQLFASRMGIKTLIGTDLIREVLRVTISDDLLPALHTSSYVAHTKLDTSFLPAVSKIIVGFEEQVQAVVVGIESAIEQAITENEILVIEGVHLVPGIIQKKLIRNKYVLPFQLVLDDEEMHWSRLARRESRKQARATSYSTHFKEIREIQEYLKQQAIRNHVELINLTNDEEALTTLINRVWEKRLPPEGEESE